MNSFGFDILLYLNDFNTLTIAPPSSFALFRDIALERFNITKAEFCFMDTEYNKYDIKSESDYFNLFNYVSEFELKEVTVYVNPGDLLKKKKASRKNSRAAKPQINESCGGGGGQNEDNDTVNDFYDGGEKDLRNLKHNLNLVGEGVKYSKQGYNLKNQARIDFIKERKEILKSEQQAKEKEINEKKQKEKEIEEAEDDFGKKNKNRKGNKTK